MSIFIKPKDPANCVVSVEKQQNFIFTTGSPDAVPATSEDRRFAVVDGMRGRLLDARRTKDYALAGKAFFTVRSGVTGTRFTYQVKAPEHGTAAERAARRTKPIWFVKVLTDSDNSDDLHSYKYIGLIRDTLEFHWGEKSKIGKDAPSVQAFYWFWNAAVRPEDALRFDKLEVWHEGRCGMCGRRLTVPESIASGYGPDCVGRVRR